MLKTAMSESTVFVRACGIGKYVTDRSSVARGTEKRELIYCKTGRKSASPVIIPKLRQMNTTSGTILLSRD